MGDSSGDETNGSMIERIARRDRLPLSLPGTAAVGRFAPEALQERWEQVGQALLVIRRRVHLSLWRKLVDNLR